MKFEGENTRPTRIDVRWEDGKIVDISYHFNDIVAPWSIREFAPDTLTKERLEAIEKSLRAFEEKEPREPVQRLAYEPPDVLESPDGNYVRYGGFHEHGYLFEAWKPADAQAVPQFILRAFKDDRMVHLKRFDVIRNMFPELSIEDEENIDVETAKFVKDVTLGS